MRLSNKSVWLGSLAALAAAGMLMAQGYGRSPRIWWDANADDMLSWDEEYQDPTGQVGIRNSLGPVHSAGHPFFQALGTNGRACITCHQPSNGMGLSAETVRARWEETGGKDPLFAAIDGSNCPSLPQASRESHSLLLDRGLIRVALPWPPKEVTPEFRIEVVQDPAGCNTDATYGIEGSQHSVSVYRRPRIAANFNFMVKHQKNFTFMTDGREPSLRTQAISATLTHEQAGTQPTEEQLRQIVDFESQVFAGQSIDLRGGLLFEPNGPLTLGPDNMARDRGGLLSGDETTTWGSFSGWKNSARPGDVQSGFRASVARGGEIFAGKRFHLTNSSEATCASCHSAKVTRWMDVGANHREPTEKTTGLPLFRVTCAANGSTVYTEDPGRALITGKCADVSAVTMQQLHALSSRAPYFANGAAQTLKEVVDFYDRQFHIGLDAIAKQDLTNFLSAL